MSDIHEGVTLGEGAPSEEPLVDRALEHLVDLVNRLLRREMAAAEAVETAEERLEAPDHALLARAIENGHRDRIDALSELVIQLGGEPAHRSSLRSLLDRTRVRLRERRGDGGVLEALASIEAELADEYRDDVATVGFTDDERAILDVGMTGADDAARRLRFAATPPLH